MNPQPNVVNAAEFSLNPVYTVNSMSLRGMEVSMTSLAIPAPHGASRSHSGAPMPLLIDELAELLGGRLAALAMMSGHFLCVYIDHASLMDGVWLREFSLLRNDMQRWPRLHVMFDATGIEPDDGLFAQHIDSLYREGIEPIGEVRGRCEHWRLAHLIQSGLRRLRVDIQVLPELPPALQARAPRRIGPVVGLLPPILSAAGLTTHDDVATALQYRCELGCGPLFGPPLDTSAAARLMRPGLPLAAPAQQPRAPAP